MDANLMQFHDFYDPTSIAYNRPWTVCNHMVGKWICGCLWLKWWQVSLCVPLSPPLSLSRMQFCPHMPRNRECFRVVIHSYWMSDSGSGNEIFAMAFNALIAEIRIVDPDVTECSDRLGAYLAYINACKFTRIIAIIYHILCPQLKQLLWGTSSSCKVGCICIIFE